MVDFVLLLCKFGSSSFVLKVGIGQGYDAFALDIRGRCGGVDNIVVYYQVAGHDKVLIQNDVDFENMFLLVEALSLKFLDVIIVHGEGSIGSCERGSSSTQSAVCEVDNVLVSLPTTSNMVRVADNSSFVQSKVLLSSGWSLLLSHVGQRFEKGMDEFRDALCKFSTQVGFRFRYVKNRKDKVVAVCSLLDGSVSGNRCKWLVVACHSTVSSYCYIKDFVNEHTCGVVFSNQVCDRLSMSRIGNLIVDEIKARPDMGGKDVKSYFFSNYGLSMSYKKAWRSLQMARSLIFGDEAASYKLLPQYLNVLSKNNPGSRMSVVFDSTSFRFRQLFLAFGACIDGFKYCRPVICLDGTFLKGRFKGILVSATGKDGNQGLYPIAFGVIDSETKDNWLWFLNELKKVICPGRVINFISDRNPGLIDAVATVFPESHHFYCLQHLNCNLRDKFTGKWHTSSFREHMVHLFSECANVHSEALFCEKLNALKESGGVTIDRFLEFLPFNKWTNVFSPGCRYGDMTSNAAESLNAWFLAIRDLPITHMVDCLRYKLMVWFSDRRDKCKRWNGVLCPVRLNRIDSNIQEGRTWEVRKCSDFLYEVCSVPSAVVNINLRTCSCFAWQHDGFPCVHACVAICRVSSTINFVIEHYFYVENYRKSYEGIIQPVPTSCLTGNDVVEGVEIGPPVAKRQPGRPKKQRFPSRGEFVRSIKCGRCGKVGSHTRRTCKEPLD